jgi:hypothetical protein
MKRIGKECRDPDRADQLRRSARTRRDTMHDRMRSVLHFNPPFIRRIHSADVMVANPQFRLSPGRIIQFAFKISSSKSVSREPLAQELQLSKSNDGACNKAVTALRANVLL